MVPAEPVAGSLGSPGRSALAACRRRRATELASWTRSLAWRAPLVAAAGLAANVLAAQAGLPHAGLLGVAVAVLVGWRLRFRPSEQARTWQRGAAGERHTARLLRRLTRNGSWSSMTWPCRSPANLDHLVIGPSGVFVIDSKQWTGNVHQSADGLVCVHGAHVQGGGLHAQGVAIVPTHLLRGALGDDRVLSDGDIELLATTAWTSLRPAA